MDCIFFRWHCTSLFNSVLQLIDQLLFRIESILVAKNTRNTTQVFDVGEMGHGDEVLRYYKNYCKAFM